jgi:hypothetical protein
MKAETSREFNSEVLRLQRWLTSIGIADVEPTGVLDEETLEVMRGLSEQLMSAITPRLQAAGVAVETQPTRGTTPARLNNIIRDVSIRLNVPSSYFRKTVALEVGPPRNGAYSEFRSGNFRGLAQANRATWETIRRRNPGLLSSWLIGSGVAEQDILFMGLLYLSNKRDHQASNLSRIPFTDGVAYLYHNQGTPAAQKYLRTGVLQYPKQSRAAIALFTEVYAHVKNPARSTTA